MTRDEILAMPAGHEMNLAIATEVFKGNYKDGWWDLLPDFSRDIAAAWEVVEKLHPNYSFLLDYDDPQTIQEIKWCCSLYGKDEPYPEYEARADTAPLAICRASLLAVMDG